ncbi:hypothetical protein Ciccas_001068 [Cichlidogyrus casuarinus]|uniref:Uncharacterized protein n=1 Tax=Cichlidogyrus casuarinus TaxID=1844966 RepID=A0ABD2QL44_9PLAT
MDEFNYFRQALSQYDYGYGSNNWMENLNYEICENFYAKPFNMMAKPILEWAKKQWDSHFQFEEPSNLILDLELHEERAESFKKHLAKIVWCLVSKGSEAATRCDTLKEITKTENGLRMYTLQSGQMRLLSITPIESQISVIIRLMKVRIANTNDDIRWYQIYLNAIEHFEQMFKEKEGNNSVIHHERRCILVTLTIIEMSESWDSVLQDHSYASNGKPPWVTDLLSNCESTAHPQYFSGLSCSLFKWAQEKYTGPIPEFGNLDEALQNSISSLPNTCNKVTEFCQNLAKLLVCFLGYCYGKSRLVIISKCTLITVQLVRFTHRPWEVRGPKVNSLDQSLRTLLDGYHIEMALFYSNPGVEATDAGNYWFVRYEYLIQGLIKSMNDREQKCSELNQTLHHETAYKLVLTVATMMQLLHDTYSIYGTYA